MLITLDVASSPLTCVAPTRAVHSWGSRSLNTEMKKKMTDLTVIIHTVLQIELLLINYIHWIVLCHKLNPQKKTIYQRRVFDKPLKTVCCTDKPALINDGGAAGMMSMQPQTDLPGQLPLPSILATHHSGPHCRTCAAGWGKQKEKEKQKRCCCD